MVIKGRVEAGRLKVDEPIDLPDGTEIELTSLDPEDLMDDAERAAFHKVLDESEADVNAGRLIDAADVLKGLRSK